MFCNCKIFINFELRLLKTQIKIYEKDTRNYTNVKCSTNIRTRKTKS